MIAFANLLSQEGAQGVSDPEPPSPEAAPASPETPPAPPAEEQPGQPVSPVEEPPQAPGEEPTADGEPNPNPPSESDPVAEALTALDDTQKSQLLEMLQEVRDGKTSWGDLKRGHKALAQHAEEVAALKQQIETLQAGATPAAEPTESPLPPAVAKLATPKEFHEAQKLHRELKRWCERNPQGGTFQPLSVKAQAIEIPAEKVLDFQDYAEDVLVEHLPARARQLDQQTQFTRQREAARQQSLADFPWLADPEHPETKQIAETLKAVPNLRQTLTPEYWAAVYQRGVKAMQAELAQRKSRNGHGAAPAAARPPAGKVPPGKPHTAPARAPARPAAGANGVNVNGLMDRNRKDGSVGSFAALLEATGG